MSKVGYIYVLTSPSGKHYIGQSWNINKRWKQYKELKCKDQSKIYYALKKYGPENFLFYIIDSAINDKLLTEKEQFWIDTYDSMNTRFGYNMKEAGSCGKLSKETKIKMSISQRARGPRKKHSEESKRKISESCKGGKTVTKEGIEKLKKALIGQKRTKQQIENMSKAQKNHPGYTKGIPKTIETKNKMSQRKLTKGGKYYYTFISPVGEIFHPENVTIFLKTHNLNSGSVAQVCKGKYTNHKGWKISRIPIALIQ